MTDKLIRTITPIPVPAQFFLQGPIVAGIASLFPAILTFGISNIISRRFEPVTIYAIAVFALFFVIFMFYLAAICFIEPTKTMYRIFPDRIEFEEGLLSKQKRTLMFDQVIDVTLSQGVLQQTVGAGSVVLVTQQLTSSGDGKLSNRSIEMRNIPNSTEIYETIRQIASNR